MSQIYGQKMYDKDDQSKLFRGLFFSDTVEC